MNVILDTNIFLRLSRGDEDCAKMEAKIIRDCDIVFINNDLVSEYTIVLERFGLKYRVIEANFARYSSRNKLRQSKKTKNLINNIITHEKDRHLIECAHNNNCSIITDEQKYLLNIKEIIKSALNIEILSIKEYMNTKP
jgi:predicted nucleic acid-binding protein